jgi:N-acetylmuramoyl-L-alanine amidase
MNLIPYLAFVFFGIGTYEGAALASPSVDKKFVNSNYTVAFRKTNLRITGVSPSCPVFLESRGVCPRGAVILDPGHDDDPDSKRNSATRNFSEGRSNMTVALLLRDLLLRCGRIPPESVQMIRWPGEKLYREYENPEEAVIPIHQPKARLDGIESRVRELVELAKSDTNPVITLSLHANTGGKAASRTDRVEVYIPERSSSDWNQKAKVLSDAVVSETLTSYHAKRQNDEDRVRLEIQNKSFVRESDFAVLRSELGGSGLLKVLVELFFIDGSQAATLDRESDLSKSVTARLTIERLDASGKKSAIYPVTRLQQSAALGLYRGLSEIYPCE